PLQPLRQHGCADEQPGGLDPRAADRGSRLAPPRPRDRAGGLATALAWVGMAGRWHRGALHHRDRSLRRDLGDRRLGRGARRARLGEPTLRAAVAIAARPPPRRLPPGARHPTPPGRVPVVERAPIVVARPPVQPDELLLARVALPRQLPS